MTYEEMMEKTADIPSNFMDHTFEMIYKWVPQIHGKLVEFGTGIGKATVAMHLVNPDLNIFTNDIGDRYGTFEEYGNRIKKIFSEHNVNEDKVHFEIRSSLDYHFVSSAQPNLDGLFIDSEH